jgi:hypothetical protein
VFLPKWGKNAEFKQTKTENTRIKAWIASWAMDTWRGCTSALSVTDIIRKNWRQTLQGCRTIEHQWNAWNTQL